MKLLIIEDEQNISKPLKKFLEKKGFSVDTVDNGKDGLEEAQVNDYDCLILDLNLPALDGMEVARELREDKNIVPILMLTARSQIYDKLEGFETGADDYLTKPFDMNELLARVRALIKRSSVNRNDVLEFEGGVLVPEKQRVEKGEVKIELTEKEAKILEYLLRNKSRAVSTEELLEHNWDSNVDLFTDAVKTHIKTLRQKIDPTKKFIKTIRGKGYLIE